MRIYLLHDPQNYRNCARFSHVGTWTSGKLCEACGQPTSKLVQPLLVEWEPDSDQVCHFSWCSYIAIAMTSLAEQLMERGIEWELGRISYVKPESKTDKKRVPYPYMGPRLSWLMPRERIVLNENKSGVELLIDCDKCGQKKYAFATRGIVIDRQNWQGEKVFHIKQFGRSRAMFITETGVEVLNALGVDNVAFSEAGAIL